MVVALGVLDLPLACWWMGLVSDMVGCRFHSVESWWWLPGEWDWILGQMAVGSKVSQSWHWLAGGWGIVKTCPETGVSLLVGAGAEAHGIPELELACWWGFWLQDPEVLELVLVCWWVHPDPRVAA